MKRPEVPAGYEFGLPEEWEILDLASQTVTYIGAGDRPFGLATAHWRLGDIERATGAQRMRARWRPMVDGIPAEAECSVSIYATDVDNDPARLMAALESGADEVDEVALPAGPSVRRTGRRPDRFVHQFFIPVPGTHNEIAFLEFWSPTFAAEGFLRPHFEGIATSFEFTHQGPEIVLDAEIAARPIEVRPLLRSTFSGWPQRFTPLAHLAVAVWLLAAIVIGARAVPDADKGVGAVLDDVSGGAFLAFFGLAGYLFDQARERAMHLTWLACGTFFLWVAITCPEGRLEFLC